MKLPAIAAQITSRRWWAAAVLLTISVTPFWRGGRDGEGYLALAIALFFAWVVWQRYPRKQHSMPVELKIPLSLFAVWMLASFVWSVDSFPAALRVITIIMTAGAFGLVRQLSVTSEARTMMRQLLILGSMPVMAFGLYLYFARVYDRAASFLYAPNAYALYLLIIWIILMYEYRRSSHKLALAGLVIVASQFLLIQSIATIALGLFLSAFLLVALHCNKQQVLGVGVAILVGLAGASGFIQLKTQVGSSNVGTPDEAAELVEAKVSGVSSRFSYWQAAGAIYLDNPIIGVGADNFQTVYPEYQEDPSLFTENPHNIVLQTYAEAGVIGGTLLMLIVAVIARLYWLNRRNPEATVYAVVLLAIFVHANFYQTSRYPVFWLLLAVLLGLFVAAIARSRAQAVPQSTNRVYAVLMLLVAVPAGIYFRSDSFADTGFDYNRERNIVDSTYYLEEAKRLPLNPVRVDQTLAIQHTFAGNFPEAIAAADQAVEANNSGQSHAAKAYVLQQTGAPINQVTIAYDTAIVKDPFNNVDMYINYTRYLIDQGQTERAQQMFDFILPYYEDEDLPRIIQFGDLPRRVAILTFQQARLASISGDEQVELDSLRRTVELYPEYEIAQNILKQRLIETQ